MLQLLALIIISLLLLTPNQSANPFITDLIITSSFLLLPVFAVNLWRDIKQLRMTTIFFILFLLAGALSVVNSIDQQASITQLALYVSYFIIFTSVRSIFPTFKTRQFIIYHLSFIIFILSAISLYNTLVARYVNYDGSGTSFMWLYFSHNHLSALLVFAIPLSLYLLLRHWKTKGLKTLFLITNCYLLITLFFTLGRASVLSLFVASIIGLFFLPKFSPKQKMVVLLSAAFLFILFALPFASQGLTLRGWKVFPVAKGRVDIADQKTNRPLYWRWAIKNFSFHPYFGTGLDTFGKVSKVSSFLEKSTALRSEHVHNFFLQMASDAGIFGLLTSVGLIGSVLWQAIKKIDGKYLQLALLVGILASTLNAFVDYDWQLPTVFLIFWILAGFAKNDN